MMRISKTLPISILLLMPVVPSLSAATVFSDEDFEDGGLGGSFQGFSGPPSNISTSNLTGRALLFDLGNQAVWDFSNTASSFYYLSFDVHGSVGSNVTLFFDNPFIIRSDLRLTGVHHVEAFYDIPAQLFTLWVDGVIDPRGSLFISRPSDPALRTIRIASQTGPPGGSSGVFEIDNFFVSDTRPLPEPSSALLLSLGALTSMARRSRPSSGR